MLMQPMLSIKVFNPPGDVLKSSRSNWKIINSLTQLQDNVALNRSSNVDLRYCTWQLWLSCLNQK